MSITSKQATENSVDEAWAELAERRYLELESGAVKGVSWDEIKNAIINQDESTNLRRRL